MYHFQSHNIDNILEQVIVIHPNKKKVNKRYFGVITMWAPPNMEDEVSNPNPKPNPLNQTSAPYS